MLPPELLQIIIAEHLESHADIQALSRTCHALHSLTSSPALAASWLWRQHGDQALFRARSLVSLPVLRQLVEVHHADINALRAAGEDDLAFSLLHAASKLDWTELLELLLSAPRINININLALGEDGMNLMPLHMACMSGSVRVARRLLTLPQIQINAAAAQGMSSLYVACDRREVAVVEALLRHPDIDVNLMALENARSPLSAAAYNL